MGRLQELYWKAQSLHDGLFALENQIHKLRRDGKTPHKTLSRHSSMANELRHIQGEMTLLEA